MTTFKTKLVLKIENEDKSSNNNSKYGFVREAVGDQVNSSRLLLCEPVTHYCGLTKREREREREREGGGGDSEANGGSGLPDTSKGGRLCALPLDTGALTINIQNLCVCLCACFVIVSVFAFVFVFVFVSNLTFSR